MGKPLKAALYCFRTAVLVGLLVSLLLMGSTAVSAEAAKTAPADNDKCLMCHSAKSISKQDTEGKHISLHLDFKDYARSVHGSLACTDCHVELSGQAFPHKAELQPVLCSKCHTAGKLEISSRTPAAAEYADSVHSLAVSRGDTKAPRCGDCHGYHDVRLTSDPVSPVNRRNIPKTCAVCHSRGPQALKENQSIPTYQQSVHGAAFLRGYSEAAVCTDCHGSHNIYRSTHLMSALNRPRLPDTCGKCHRDALEEYEAGIHGQALKHGKLDAPVCTDCHGEHNIRPHADHFSTVYPSHVRVTCSKCHEDERIQRKHGLSNKRLRTFMGSYHGIASKFGQTTAANCATCHESHKILPSTNAESAVNKKNIPATCGKCHPRANANFAKGTIHLDPSTEQDALLYWVGKLYSMFIAVLIGSFCVYILLDLRYRFSAWLRARRTATPEGAEREE